MKQRVVSFFLIAFGAVCAQSGFSQQFHAAITFDPAGASVISGGSDAWFGIPQNYEDQSGKYISIYLCSDTTTTVHVQLFPGAAQAIPVVAYKTASVNVPLDWELKRSGVVEPKTVHVWADNGSLAVYMFSHSLAASDGTYILSQRELGTNYIVASYESLFQGVGTVVFDYPTEFCITTPDRSATVTITPTVDLRDSIGGTSHPAYQPFTENIPARSSVLYKAVQAQNADDYDLTGTVIHSTAPIQVIGASQCSNIPTDYPYCDFIEHALPPIDSWGKEYYSLPFLLRKGGDSFTFIGSAKDQKIYRQYPLAGRQLFAVIDKQYGFYRVPEITEPTHWYSSEPFLVVQFINSSTWPDNQATIGDPAMVVLNPVEHYQDSILAVAPTVAGGQSAFTNFAAVIVADSAASETTIDSKKITSFTRIPIDGVYSGYQVSSLQSGAHAISSSRGVSAVVYGYGTSESYAWSSGGWKSHEIASPTDTIPPQTSMDDSGKCALLTTIEHESWIADLSLGAVTNMQPTMNTNVSKHDSISVARFCVIDTFKAGSAALSYSDVEGNRTSIALTYSPVEASIYLDPHDIPITEVGKRRNINAITIVNNSNGPVRVDSITVDDYALALDGVALGSLPFIAPAHTSREVPFVFEPDVAASYTFHVHVVTANAGIHDTVVHALGTLHGAVAEGKRHEEILNVAVSPSVVVTAKFVNEQSGTAVVEIFNLLGARVVLFSEYLAAGPARVVIPSSALSSGTYFCRIAGADHTIRTARFEIP